VIIKDIREFIFAELKRLFAEEHMVGSNGSLCGIILDDEGNVGTTSAIRVTCAKCKKIQGDN